MGLNKPLGRERFINLVIAFVRLSRCEYSYVLKGGLNNWQ
jgi:hypothetical protein